MISINQRIADELGVRPQQVDATVQLLDDGATVPFIARYRKEVTGSLDDTQLRQLDERLRYLRELEERRATILKSIDEQGKLSDELKGDILNAENKTQLEDLYLPYKPKRRTKGQIAIEAGLEPLALGLLNNQQQDPTMVAHDFINTDNGIADEKAALEGAKYILMEKFAENAKLLAQLREYLWENGLVKSQVVAGKEKEGDKYKDYFEFNEPLKAIPSHRALAIFRGRNEGILQLSIVPNTSLLEDEKASNPCEGMIAKIHDVQMTGTAASEWFTTVIRWTWRVKLQSHMETELFSRIREAAEGAAIEVFSQNLKNLLMAAPAGNKTTIGLDPGLRTGVKVTVVDGTGKLLHHGTIFPHPPQNAWDKSIRSLAAIAAQCKAELVSIGNGTGSRETDKLVGELMKKHPELKLKKIMVNEAGASIYSASEFAAKEFPDLDVSLRGAVSIARRLQDPLAELVKIEPKAIGVGQYQHDVSQVQLARSLDAVVEDCVNTVGVDLNTASAPLLARVSGLNQTLARNIVSYRDSNGRFTSREQLKKVERLGPKAFEQAAGFLRILEGENPLDRSAVHPEAYPVVEKIVAQSSKPVEQLLGDASYLKTLQAANYTDEKFGIPTVTDILKELEKPGRDPRGEFKTAEFKEGVESIKDLKPGMVLEGVISNVTNFGAFVDIGVHHNGLVHVSHMTDKFVSDPMDVVKAGDIVKVKVLEIDTQRNRIALTMRMSDPVEPGTSNNKAKPAPSGGNKSRGSHQRQSRNKQAPVANSAFGDALAAALKKK